MCYWRWENKNDLLVLFINFSSYNLLLLQCIKPDVTMAMYSIVKDKQVLYLRYFFKSILSLDRLWYRFMFVDNILFYNIWRIRDYPNSNVRTCFILHYLHLETCAISKYSPREING